MKTEPTIIFLGDLARALDALKPSGDDAQSTRAHIACLLGFEWADQSVALSPTSGPAAKALSAKTEIKTQRPRRDTARSTEQAPLPRAEPKWIPSTIETETTRIPPPSVASLFASARPLPPAGVLDWPGPPFEPLFEARWTRGIVTALLATSRDGDVDVERLVDQISRVEPLQRLPRVAWPTLRRGVQVLVDTSPAMTPFAEDQRWLIGRIRQIAGIDKTTVQRFVGCPDRGLAAGFQEAPQPWQPPPSGTPVLVLTDLGASRTKFPNESASEAEWIDFALAARHAGCPLIALTPQSPARFSSGLRRALCITPWDRRTTAGWLRRRVGRAHRVV